MGQALAQIAVEKGHTILTQVGRFGFEILSGIRADVVIDFSHASQVPLIVEACLRENLPLITGTTGWYEHLPLLRAKAAAYPTARWLWGGNFSRGIALFKILLKSLASLSWSQLSGWEAILVETHHHRKKDAPSGTAIELTQIFPVVKAIHSLRVGEVIGEHRLLLSGPGEEVEVLHRAHDRRIFAEGAIWAAQWLLNQGHFVGPFEEAFSLSMRQ